MVREEIKKKHHYLPSFYLKGFTKLDSNCLWVYEKDSLNVRPSSPENEGCQRFYHTFVTHEGNRDTNSIEDYFGKIETKTGLILADIHRRQKLTEQDRKELALFISFMLTRVPLFRNEIEKMAAEHIDHVGLDTAISDFKISIDTMGDALGIKPNISENELTKLPSRRGSVFSLAQIFHVAFDFYPKFLNLQWRFLFSSQDYKYVTSDNPLYFYSASASGALPRDDFLKEDIEITLPLSKEVALMAKRYNIQDGYGDAQVQTIKNINKRTVLCAKSNIYSAIKSDSFHNLVKKTKNNSPYMVMFKKGAIS
ncbi:MAG: DUF4238 domain-containing protein [Candidatus Brocadiales bacterium]|nr:DUF4238 domain-containing protein [Candidatus Brocadiales bacterium]